MTEEEKEAIEYWKNYMDILHWNTQLASEHHMSVLLNLIQKLQKEIEELKKPKDNIQVVYCGRSYGKTFKAKNYITKEYISKDKIRDKIKELDDLNSKFSQRVINSKERYFTEMIQNILKELLEEEK